MSVVPTHWGCLRCTHPANGDVRVVWYEVDEETFTRRLSDTLEFCGANGAIQTPASKSHDAK